MNHNSLIIWRGGEENMATVIKKIRQNGRQFVYFFLASYAK